VCEEAQPATMSKLYPHLVCACNECKKPVELQCSALLGIA